MVIAPPPTDMPRSEGYNVNPEIASAFKAHGFDPEGAYSDARSMHALADQVRALACEVAQGINTEQSKVLDARIHSIRSLHAQHWESLAGRRYREKIQSYEEKAVAIELSLTDCSSKYLRAGEEIGDQLDELGRTLTLAGASLETRIGELVLASDSEDSGSFDDAFKDRTLLERQQRINDLCAEATTKKRTIHVQPVH